METVVENNFKAIQEALNTMNVRCAELEKTINSHIGTQQMMQEVINTLQKEIILLKVQSMGSGPTVGK